MLAHLVQDMPVISHCESPCKVKWQQAVAQQQVVTAELVVHMHHTCMPQL